MWDRIISNIALFEEGDVYKHVHGATKADEKPC
jgi:hypothetical protein